jgi:PAS domain S-box-containing protein
VSAPATSTGTTNGSGPAATLLDNLPDAFLLMDERGVVRYANATAERLFGYSIDELASRAFASLLAAPFGAEYEEVARSHAAGESVPMLGERREVVCKRPDGAGVAIELSLSEVQSGKVRHHAAVARDIRELKREEARLREMADLDSLTGLMDRVGFEHALTRHVDYAARYGSGGSVIALGIDTFKYVNESLGSVAGDELLVGLVEVLKGRLRKTDVLARVGGDVFGILDTAPTGRRRWLSPRNCSSARGGMPSSSRARACGSR